LAQAVLQILRRAALGSHHEGAPDGLDRLKTQRLLGMHDHMLAVPQREMPRPHLHLQQRLLMGGHGDKRIIVDHLDVAGPVQGHSAGPRLQHVRQAGLGRIGPVRQHVADVAVQILRYLGDDVVRDDRAGDLVDVEQQGKQADDGEDAADGHGNMRNPLRTECLVKAAQHHHHVEDGAKEKTEHGLDLSVGHERRDQAWPELVGRER
jgi:hypothetical protein